MGLQASKSTAKSSSKAALDSTPALNILVPLLFLQLCAAVPYPMQQVFDETPGNVSEVYSTAMCPKLAKTLKGWESSPGTYRSWHFGLSHCYCSLALFTFDRCSCRFLARLL